jgi:chromosome segregation ATPase
MRIDSLECSLNNLSERVNQIEEAVSHYPEYRQQSIEIQKQLRQADNSIVDLCREIKEDVVANRQMLNDRLKNLEGREKNALRAKILDEYRLYTDDHKNPMKAWSEMEHHSFFKLVEDYESLGGNDYVHKTILPAMNELDVIPMTDLEKLKELYISRQV